MSEVNSKKHSKKGLKIALGTSAGVLAAGGIATAVVLTVNKSNIKAIPTSYLTFKDGKITGYDTSKDISGYNTLSIPAEVDGVAITGVAANAFKDAFKDDTNKKSSINRIVFSKNIASFEESAFEGCNTIETLDFTAIENEETLAHILQDETLKKSAFKLGNTKSTGEMLTHKNVSADYADYAKGCLIDAGLSYNWFKKEQQPVFGDLGLEGLSKTTLSGKQYHANTDTQQLKALYSTSEQNVSENCVWKILPITEIPENTIGVNIVGSGEQAYAQIKWTSKLPAGTHKFRVQATYKLNDEEETEKLKVTSDEITLNITEVKLSLKGDTSISAKNFTAGEWEEAYKVELLNDEYVESQLISLSIINDGTHAMSIDKTSKKLSWDNTIPTGTYSFEIEAKYNIENNTLTATLPVTISVTDRAIKVITPADMPSKIDELTKGSVKTAFDIKILDDTNDYDRHWTLEKVGSSDISHFHIDETSGLFSWDAGVQAGTYSMKAKVIVDASVGGTWTGYSDAFTISVSTLESSIEGKTFLQSKNFTEGVEAEDRVLKVGDISVPQSEVTWSLSGQPSGVTIDSTGKIHWDDTIDKGTYTFTVVAKSGYKGVAREASLDVTFSVTEKRYNVTGGSTKLSGKEYDNGTDQNVWKAEAVANAEDIEWSLVPVSGTLPETLGIDKYGRVYWSNLPAQSYKFYVKATVNGHWYGTSGDVVTLTIAQKELKITQNGAATSFDSTDYHSGTSATSWTVTFDGHDVTSSSDLTWTISPTMTNSIKMNSNGRIEWGDDLDAGTYNFTAIGSYSYKGSVRTVNTVPLTLNVAETLVDISYTEGTTDKTLTGDVGVEGSAPGTFSIKVDGKTVDPSRIEWHFTTRDGSAVFGKDQIWIDSTGTLRWSADLETGKDYKFIIWAYVDGEKWWGWFGDHSIPKATDFTLNIRAEHNLEYDDLKLDNEGYVTGLSTNISGYKTLNPSLTIKVGSTWDQANKKVKGIKSFKDIANQQIISSLTIESDIDLDLSSANIVLTNIKTLTTKAASGKYVTIDATTTSHFKDSLTTLELKNADVKDNAFYSFPKLNLLNLEGCENLKIGEQAFAETRKSDFTIKGAQKLFDTTTTLSPCAFEHSAISFAGQEESTKFTISNSIPRACFKDCDNLELHLVVADGADLADSAFYGSAIYDVTFTGATAKVGTYAFSHCSKLTSLQFNKAIAEIGNYAFESVGVSTLTVYDVQSAGAEAKLATTLGSNVFYGLKAYSFSTVVCKNAESVRKWFYALNNINTVFADFTYTPDALKEIMYSSQDRYVTYTVKPKYIVYNTKLEVKWNINHTDEAFDRVNSFVVFKGNTYNYGSTSVVTFTDTSITIEASEMDSAAIANGIEIHIVSNAKTNLIWENQKSAWLAEEPSTGGNKIATIEGFKCYDGFSKTDYYTLSDFNIYDADGTLNPTAKSNMTCQIVDIDTLNFNVEFNVDKEVAGKHYLFDFTVMNKYTGQEWKWGDTTTNKLHLYVDYQWTPLTNADFNIDTYSNTITSFKNELKSDMYYVINITLGDHEHDNYANKISENLFKNLKNADMIDTLTINIVEDNLDSVVFKKGSLTELTWLHHLTINNTSTTYACLNDFFLMTEQDYQEQKYNEHLYDVSLRNVELFSGAFAGFLELRKLTINKGTLLRDRSFERCNSLYEIDVSDWGTTIPDNWLAKPFNNIGGYKSNTKYILCASGAETVWMNYLNEIEQGIIVVKPDSQERQETEIWYIKAKA